MLNSFGIIIAAKGKMGFQSFAGQRIPSIITLLKMPFFEMISKTDLVEFPKIIRDYPNLFPYHR